ncbi:AfsR/SARP family transcriptional regulator [Streptomyces meridianus]|uniref:AfsR/SARP family transcriptional regulator n=1 Tax=Streptomyces meridianus TaxID=2938945 RepID=A0ABT0XCV6_9ACTN|nr:AfsR/SARP family transcriptional regulator [Streptomyces meridianus]MCM2580220.1 AfsR/SARP family transcriptional regulator [Streptomyces meridianus]
MSRLGTLRSAACRLRSTLGAESLVVCADGYVLRASPARFDVALAESRAEHAEEELCDGRLGQARRLLTSALELWDGEPLSGLCGSYAEVQRARLSEWRLSLVERRLEIDLDLGRHDGVIAELAALSSEHPYHEHVRDLQMLALHRSGRRAEALAVYSATRRFLREDIGIEPGSELTDLHRRILVSDCGLDVRNTRASVPVGSRWPARCARPRSPFRGSATSATV